MQVHITNIYGLVSVSAALQAQNRAVDIATKMLGFKELGIYCYDINTDTNENLSRRLDGIIASVKFGDTVVFQFPTWNGIRFDKAIVERLNAYRGLKKIFFIHDIPPLMFEGNRYLLEQYIDFYNQADVVILPSQKLADFLYSNGFTVEKIVCYRIWDFPVTIDQTVAPEFKRVINFSGDPDLPKFEFVKEWNHDTVELKVTAEKGDWAKGKNISFLGWFNHDISLLTALRRSGGFGLVWSSDSYWREYMKMNANYKLSAYLAAGIPVIVSNDIAERNTIVRKNLGLAVDSLDEAVSKIEKMDKKQYDDMAANVAEFSNLLREGFFTRKCLIDAVFQLLYD